LRGLHLTSIGNGAILLEPEEGFDPASPDHYLAQLLEMMQQLRARRLIYDLSGVAVIDPLYYQWLLRVDALCRVGDIEMVAANIRPEAAFALARQLEADPPFRCVLEVERGRE